MYVCQCVWEDKPQREMEREGGARGGGVSGGEGSEVSST